MTEIAKIFMNGRSQAVRLPVEFRFDTREVYIRRDPVTGDVILSQRKPSLEGLLEALAEADFPGDFLSPDERDQGTHERDPLAGLDD